MTAPAEDTARAFYTPKEVAAACRMNYQSVLDQIKNTTIPATKFGRIYKVPAWWVKEQLGSNESQPLQPVVLETVPAASPDYGPLASMLEILGRAFVQAAGELRGTPGQVSS